MHPGRPDVHRHDHPISSSRLRGMAPGGQPRYASPIASVGEVPVMTGPGDEVAADMTGRGRLRASHADREQVIGTLKTAFVQGRLTQDEFDARVDQVYTSRTYAELAEVTTDLPAGPAGTRPPRDPWRATKLAWRAVYAIILPTIVTLIVSRRPGSTTSEGCDHHGRGHLSSFLAVRRSRDGRLTAPEALRRATTAAVSTGRGRVRLPHYASLHRARGEAPAMTEPGDEIAAAQEPLAVYAPPNSTACR